MKEYNPQGGSLSHSLLPGVASYRRQPRAIKSTTPMGLPYHHPLITTTTKGMVRIMAILHRATA